MMRRFPLKILVSVILIIGLFHDPNICAEPLEPASLPSLVSSLEIPASLEFCGEQVPVEIHEVRERLEKEILLTLWDRPQVILWLKRSRRYLPTLEKMLKQGGLPDDVKFVAIAESALRPHAGSQRGAVGFWQFLESTGRKYGLEINDRIDERRSVTASTQAAIRYFSELHETFGSWTLAAAAYNMGEDGLMAEILEQGTHGYYRLYLPLETQRYVFRILSVKLIFSDPEKYGFRLSDEDYYPPLEYDQIQLDCFQDTPIRLVAKAAKTPFKVIKDLNPEIRGYYLAEGSHVILIPKGVSKDFRTQYQHLLELWLTDKEERVYEVKQGDTLSSIADRFGVPLRAIIIWNRLDPKTAIHAGDKLVIYRRELPPQK
jgi:hypothetical protein